MTRCETSIDETPPMSLQKESENEEVREEKQCEVSKSSEDEMVGMSESTTLGIGGLVPTNVTLQLADGSTKFLKGKVEDVPLKVGNFTIPVDFIVLGMTEDALTPIILGRPFLATGGAIINVREGKLTLNVGDDEFCLTIDHKRGCPSPIKIA
ncbi:uncharacterized protein LOC110710645 [Chenopodium quinoa]|uniref:uncharacterized protein LOC110710645 n=1 Tax=Chenopodium quinoa TaxID=63459 RepID=UPI000B7876CF|nr:uncharacterized protein LOC110710645 [Chenopodium quinoa]